MTIESVAICNIISNEGFNIDIKINNLAHILILAHLLLLDD